ncbi:MAG: carboxypeptidase [Candidatus Bathyarchaeota archaeon]|nr:MAG: carboxypeptidase [Candidatus Bathyarchaeota archaeon]
MVELTFDRYHGFDEMTEILEGFAAEYPGLCELYSIGWSSAGRELWLVELTNKSTGEAEEKPAVYVDGNTHAGEVTGKEVCLWMIDRLLKGYGEDDEITGLLNTRCFYILPCLNPDGSELYLTTPYKRTGGGIPNPEFEWKQGLYEEDVDGDGFITQMRVQDPNGDWRVSEEDLRIMVKRRPDEFGGSYYRVYGEGFIRGYDGGEIKMAPTRWIGGTNRNWPERWKPESRAYGADLPLDEPEARAQADFWRKHKNICGGLAFHTHGGIIVRSSSAVSDNELDIRDIATYEFIGELGTELTGDSEYPSVGGNSALFTLDPKRPRVGTAKDFFFDIMGVYAWTYELWDMAGHAGLGNFRERGGIRFGREDNRSLEENLKLLAWNDEALGGEGFSEWTPFDHLQLGPVEIGGWKDKFTWRNPPTKFLAEECARAGTFMIAYAALSPLTEIVEVKAESLGAGLHKLSVVVKNRGFLPTNITEQAKKANIAKPVTLELMHGSDVEVLINAEKLEVGHVEGRSDKLPGRFYTPLGPKKAPPGRYFGGMWGRGGDSSSKAAEWLLRVKDGGEAEVTVVASSEKGGVDRETVTLTG